MPMCVCQTVWMFHGLWAWHPLVGVWIGILGLLGVVVALTRDPTKIGRREKAAWILIMTVLLLLEIKSVYQDRNEHDREQADARERETKSFEAIANGISSTIQQSQQHFDATMAKSDQLTKLSQEGLANVTGGDSYAYIEAGIGSRPPFQLIVSVRGKHAVHNLLVSIQTLPKAGEIRDNDSIMRQMNSMHSLPVGNGDFLPGVTPIGETIMPGRYGLTVVSRNQWTTEQIDIAQCSDGQWSEAIKMNGRPGKKENKSWVGRPGCHQPFD
jgi:hypothetical protein